MTHAKDMELLHETAATYFVKGVIRVSQYALSSERSKALREHNLQGLEMKTLFYLHARTAFICHFKNETRPGESLNFKVSL